MANLISFVKTDNILILIVILCALIYPKSVISQVSRNIDPELQNKIDDYIENEYLPGSHISGLVLSIVETGNSNITYTTGFGLANRENNVPNDNQTQFLVASITKSFTSIVLAKLLNEKFPDLGETVLDTPIRQLIPNLNFTLIDRFRSEYATVRDLLAHRLCLFRGDISILADAFNEPSRVAFSQRYNEEICGVRSEFQYNNQIYTLAGEIIAELAGKSYDEAVEEFLFELGMQDSIFGKLDDDYNELSNRARAYFVLDDVPYPMNTDLFKRPISNNAAMGLYVTPDDMTNYMRFHLNQGNLNGRQIVSKTIMEWLIKPSNLYNFNKFKESDDELVISQYAYGLGLFLSDYDGYQYIQHGGDAPTFHSLFSLYPSKNLSIFSSVNMGPVLIDRMILHANIFEILKGTNDTERKEKSTKLAKQLEREKAEREEKWLNELMTFLTKHRNKSKIKARIEFSGVYGSGNLGEVNITERFNNETNQTQYYVEYGQYYTGYLELFDEEENVYKFLVENDVIHDDYAAGAKEGMHYVAFDEDLLHIFKMYTPMSYYQLMGTFKFGTRLDDLPTVPWSPDSC